MEAVCGMVWTFSGIAHSILMTCTTQILVVLLIGCAMREISFNQSEALPRSGKYHVISMEFLCLLLRCHFEHSSGDLVKHQLVSKAISFPTSEMT